MPEILHFLVNPDDSDFLYELARLKFWEQGYSTVFFQGPSPAEGEGDADSLLEWIRTLVPPSTNPLMEFLRIGMEIVSDPLREFIETVKEHCRVIPIGMRKTPEPERPSREQTQFMALKLQQIIRRDNITKCVVITVDDLACDHIDKRDGDRHVKGLIPLLQGRGFSVKAFLCLASARSFKEYYNFALARITHKKDLERIQYIKLERLADMSSLTELEAVTEPSILDFLRTKLEIMRIPERKGKCVEEGRSCFHSGIAAAREKSFGLAAAFFYKALFYFALCDAQGLVALTFGVLGDAYKFQGKWASARDLYQLSYALDLSIFGEGHEFTRKSKQDLAEATQHMRTPSA